MHSVDMERLLMFSFPWKPIEMAISAHGALLLSHLIARRMRTLPLTVWTTEICKGDKSGSTKQKQGNLVRVELAPRFQGAGVSFAATTSGALVIAVIRVVSLMAQLPVPVGVVAVIDGVAAAVEVGAAIVGAKFRKP